MAAMDDEGYYNRLHEIQDSYGKDVRNLDGIDTRDEVRPLFSFLSKTQRTEDTEKGPYLKLGFGSSSHLDGIGGGHLVRDFELEQGLVPSDLGVLQGRAFMKTPQTFGVVREYPARTDNSLTKEVIKNLLHDQDSATFVFNCLLKERCDDDFLAKYATITDGSNIKQLFKPTVPRHLDELGGDHLLSTKRSFSIGRDNLSNAIFKLDSFEGEDDDLSYKQFLDYLNKSPMNYGEDLEGIGSDHTSNYNRDLDDIGEGHLLTYKKDLDSIGGGNLLTYKKDLDSIGGGNLLTYKKDLDSIGGGNLLTYKKDLDSIGGGNLLTYKKDLDSIGGGNLLTYKKDLDSIGGGNLLTYKKDLDSIGGGNLLTYKKDLDSIGGGNLLTYKKDLDSVGGGNLLTYKKDLDSIGGGHLLTYKKDLDSIGGGNLLTYKKDLDSIGGGNLLTYKKDLDSIGGGHLLNYKKSLDSIGGGNLLKNKKSLESTRKGYILKKDLDSIGGGHLLNLKRGANNVGNVYTLDSPKYIGNSFSKHKMNPLRTPSVPYSLYNKYYTEAGFPVRPSRTLCPSSTWFQNQLKIYLAKEEANKYKVSQMLKVNLYNEDLKRKNEKMKLPRWLVREPRRDDIHEGMEGLFEGLEQASDEDQSEAPFRGIIELNLHALEMK